MTTRVSRAVSSAANVLDEMASDKRTGVRRNWVTQRARRVVMAPGGATVRLLHACLVAGLLGGAPGRSQAADDAGARTAHAHDAHAHDALAAVREHVPDVHAHDAPAHKCAHDALHAAHGGAPVAVAPQVYARSATIEKRSGELSPSDGVAPMRIAVYDGFLESDPGRTCYREGEPFSVGGADEHAPDCGADSTTYCRGRCTAEFVLTAEKRRFLQQMLIPELMRITRALLSVQPVSGGLILNGSSCGFYGGVRIPPSLSARPGLADADFVLFLTARPIFGDTIAYAGHCQTDQNGRPVAAHFNWSPSHFQSRMDARLFAYYTRVALHELTHALVFSPSLIADFPRGEDGRLRSLETIASWHGRQRAVVSPRVAAAARAQLGCASLQGAHLEDGGGTGSAGSHWESRLFRDEYMTAAASPGPRVLSAITLALFADSGWYVVDGAQAEPLLWGFRAGCTFVHESCAAWREIGASVDGVALPTFTCDAHSADACHYDQRSKAYCELKRYSWLPSDERYFAHDGGLGGYSQMLDYCPVFRAYSNGDCTDTANAPGGLSPQIGFVDALDAGTSAALFGPRVVDASQYCASCRCFETDAASAVGGAAGGARGSALAPGCFRFRCIDERTLQVHLGGGRWAGCPPLGGVARLQDEDARGKPLHVKCPPAARVCAFRSDRWPHITDVSPRRGPVHGGTNVTVRGANFASDTAGPPSVYVGDVRAERVVVHSESLLTFVLGTERGATSRELLDVSLEDDVGRSAVAFQSFTYLPGWQPYAQTVAGLALFLFGALYALPRHLTPLLAAHARHVRARELQLKHARAQTAGEAATLAARAPAPDEAQLAPQPARRESGGADATGTGAGVRRARIPMMRAKERSGRRSAPSSPEAGAGQLVHPTGGAADAAQSRPAACRSAAGHSPLASDSRYTADQLL